MNCGDYEDFIASTIRHAKKIKTHTISRMSSTTIKNALSIFHAMLKVHPLFHKDCFSSTISGAM